MPEGSPLLVHTRRLATALQQRLPEWKVLAAMRYGQPALRTVLRELRASGIRRPGGKTRARHPGHQAHPGARDCDAQQRR